MEGIFRNFGVAAALYVLFTSNAFSANTTIELQAVDGGIYDGVTASHNPLSTAIYVQQDSVYASRNFFVFDFTGLSMSNLVSVELFANNSWNSSSENNIEFALFDVSTNVSDLRGGGNGQFAVFNDIGSGVNYANLQITNPGRYDNITMTFNQAGIDNAKATFGLFAIGGAFTSQTTGLTWLFADNGNINAPFNFGLRLTFTDTVSAVPENDTSALLLAGLSVFGLISYRRNQK